MDRAKQTELLIRISLVQTQSWELVIPDSSGYQ